MATGEKPNMKREFPFGAGVTYLRKSPGKLGKMEERCDDGRLGDSRGGRIYSPAANEFKHCRSWTVSENIFPAKEQKGCEKIKKVRVNLLGHGDSLYDVPNFFYLLATLLFLCRKDIYIPALSSFRQ